MLRCAGNEQLLHLHQRLERGPCPAVVPVMYKAGYASCSAKCVFGCG